MYRREKYLTRRAFNLHWPFPLTMYVYTLPKITMGDRIQLGKYMVESYTKKNYNELGKF